MSNFKVWIDSPSSSNCLSQSDFSGDTQRTNGFQAGKAASAIRINSALRQANLVVAALMDSMNVSSSLNLNSSVTDVKTAIDNYFSTNFGTKVSKNGGELKDTITTFSQASSRTNITSGEKTSVSLGKISKYLNDLNSLAFKSSVGTSDIDNSAITSGKIASGAITTAKFANDAVAPKATIASYASADTSKGTIETRLGKKLEIRRITSSEIGETLSDLYTFINNKSSDILYVKLNDIFMFVDAEYRLITLSNSSSYSTGTGGYYFKRDSIFKIGKINSDSIEFYSLTKGLVDNYGTLDIGQFEIFSTYISARNTAISLRASNGIIKFYYSSTVIKSVPDLEITYLEEGV